MKNPVYLALKHADGSLRNIIVEPVLKHDLSDKGIYKIYKTSIDNESALFTETLEIDEGQSNLADKNNPDYLGTITFGQADHQQWKYEGDLLTRNEQQQIANYLQQKT